MSPYSTVDLLHFAINFSGVGASYNRKLTGLAPLLLRGEFKRLGEFPPLPSYSVVRKVGKTELSHLEGVGAGLCGGGGGLLLRGQRALRHAQLRLPLLPHALLLAQPPLHAW